MSSKTPGYSLVELLVVLSIIAIGITLSAPDLEEFFTRNRVSSQLNQLVRAIHMARQTAIFLNQVVTLCPSADGNSCSRDWAEGMLLFVDSNNDRNYSQHEALIHRFDALTDGDKLFWRAFRARPFLLMRPKGFTAYQNGTFTYCPHEGLQYARGIVLNSAGRIRLSQDSDRDGIDEGANGRPLRC
jgi:type IV fimbrial biogenesis protein FimT